MSLCEKRYIIKGHRNEEYLLTAKELCERIVKDSKHSDYNWIAPARELVRICKKTSFPSEYALIIKVAILNCFANIEHRANCGGDRYKSNLADKNAVQYCYNSLYCINPEDIVNARKRYLTGHGINSEDVVNARKRYLTEMISTACSLRAMDPLYHPGPTFNKLREDWVKSNFEEYFSEEKIDFDDKFMKTLRNSFVELIKNAESNGAFEEDKKKDREAWKEFYKRLMAL